MRSKATFCIILFTMCCMSSGHVTAAEDIVFRAAVTPEEPWVGQKALLKVDILAKEDRKSVV